MIHFNFVILDLWRNNLTNDVFILISLAGNQFSKGQLADWYKITSSSGGVLSLTGNNTGIPVFPLLGNINVKGDLTTIDVLGDPATHTLTISAVGTGLVSSLTGNSGGAVFPTAGNTNVVGDGVGINIVGNPGTSTLTVPLVGSVRQRKPSQLIQVPQPLRQVY